MKTLRFEQFLPIPLEEAWTFFASPANLDLITPPGLKFKILDPLPDKMHKGMIIHYRIKPMMNIPMKWITEITEYEEYVSFTDVQIKGPYQLWNHQHHFKSVDGSVLMTDILDYDIGFGIIGRFAGTLWVDSKVSAIFEFRRSKLQAIFK